MGVESAADRLEFFDTDEFGELFTVDGVSVLGQFFNAYAATEDIEGTRPAIIVRTADVTSAANGDTVVRNSTSYTITNIQPDGEGMSVLFLELV
jgi:hypothetical protein